MTNIYAYTEVSYDGTLFPEYVSLNAPSTVDDKIELTVRGPATIGGAPGPTATISLSRDELERFALAILAFIKGH